LSPFALGQLRLHCGARGAVAVRRVDGQGLRLGGRPALGAVVQQSARDRDALPAKGLDSALSAFPAPVWTRYKGRYVAVVVVTDEAQQALRGRRGLSHGRARYRRRCFKKGPGGMRERPTTARHLDGDRRSRVGNRTGPRHAILGDEPDRVCQDCSRSSRRSWTARRSPRFSSSAGRSSTSHHGRVRR
jgi:hypothetical protein